MAMNAGLAAFIANKKKSVSAGGAPTGLQQAAAARLNSEKAPPGKSGKFQPKKKAAMVPDTDGDGI